MLPLYFVNSLRPCLLSLSIFVFHYQFFDFPVFVNRSLSFFSHCLYCLLFFHCVSSILYVCVCFLCHSCHFLAFPRQFFYFSAFVSRSYSTSLSYVAAVQL